MERSQRTADLLKPAEYIEVYGIADYAQEMLTLLTLHRPDDPLQFITSCLGEMSAGVNPLIHAYHMLRLTQHQSHSVFMDQLAEAYCALAHRKGKSFITTDEMLLLLQALTVELPREFRERVLASIEEQCPKVPRLHALVGRE